MSGPSSRDPAEIKAQNIKNFFTFIVLISLIGAFTASHLVELNLNTRHVKAIAEHHCEGCFYKLFPKAKRFRKQDFIVVPAPEGPKVDIK